MRRLLIAGNWKMYKTIAEAVQHVKALRPLVKDITDIEIAVAPAFPAIQAVADALRGSNVTGAGIGQRHAAGRAHQELATDVALQLADLAADGRQRDSQIPASR